MVSVRTDNPIVICGIGGSGTRVVATTLQMLGVHIGSCLNPSQDNLWATFLLRRKEWQRKWPQPDEIKEALNLLGRKSLGCLTPQEAVSLRDLLDRRAELFQTEIPADLAQKTVHSLHADTPPLNADHWGWKEPNSHLFLPQINDVFPRARIIFVTRDGCDMAYSRNQNQVRNWAHHFGLARVETQNPSASLSLDYWICATQTALSTLSQRFEDRTYVLRYSDLCASPQQTLDRIATFLGLHTSEAALQNAASIVIQNKTNRAQDMGYQGLHPKQIGQARALYETMARSVMRRQLVPSENAMTAPPLSSLT